MLMLNEGGAKNHNVLTLMRCVSDYFWGEKSSRAADSAGLTWAAYYGRLPYGASIGASAPFLPENGACFYIQSRETTTIGSCFTWQRLNCHRHRGYLDDVRSPASRPRSSGILAPVLRKWRTTSR